MKKSELLKHVSDYEIFNKYIGKEISLGEMISSPLPNRKDNNPSFNIFRHYKGELIFKDYAYGTGDCIKFVSLMHDLKRRDLAIDMIINDFDINVDRKPYRPIIEERKKTLIDFREQPFTLQEALYWYSYGIDNQTLKKFDVHSVEKFRVNNSKWFYSKGMCFSYVFENGTKIYKPYDNEGYKWITNCNGGFQGWNQLPIAGNIVVITKSLKDVMVLDKHNISAIAPHGESMKISDEDIDMLKRRFRKIYVLYDIDEAGYKASEYICNKYNLKRIFINNNYCIYKNKNENKDISDYRQKYGEKRTEELLRTKLLI
jgi:5S rRNA maturation endonuclease (ribonuclease M5)